MARNHQEAQIPGLGAFDTAYPSPDCGKLRQSPRSIRYKTNRLFSLNKQYAFSSALHLAYMKNQISATHYMFMVDLVSGTSTSPSGGHPRHSTLKIMGCEVPGVVLIWPEKKPVTVTQRCFVYLPKFPDRSFHLFQTFDEFKEQLWAWLCEGTHTHYFASLMPVRHRAEFIRRTDTKDLTLDSLLIRRPPIINEPALYLETRHIPQSQNPFEVGWRLHLEQIRDDARMLMVPTGDEDTKARLTRLESYLNVGVSVLGIALGFVPVLGELLLAVSVIQLGAEVFDGIAAWRRGDRAEALEYLFDIAQNLALVASTSGAAKPWRCPMVTESG